MGSLISNITVYAHVGNRGWEASRIEFSLSENRKISDLSLTSITDSVSKTIAIHSCMQQDCQITIETAPFSYIHDFQLSGSAGQIPFCINKKEVTTVETAGLNKFQALSEGNVRYRLYCPDHTAPRPLLLFLHGGGECGYDNLLQMVGTLGAIKLAELYPDFYIMAPQAPGNMADMIPDPSIIYKNSFSDMTAHPTLGWSREYLSSICDIIRKMISDGQADPNRIYVTGMSMGGAGTLRALSTGTGLFAAAAPICPTMMPETYQILCALTNEKIWISTAYADHTLYRHKYIVDGILHLRDHGNQNAHLTLFGPEEMAQYGFGTDPTLSLKEKLEENHSSWVLTLNQEHGILEWLVSQHK